MKEKNGFIFIETIVVLTVTMVSLLALYNSYVLVIKSAQQKKYYNNINDVYKANTLKNLLKEENKNYKITDSHHFKIYKSTDNKNTCSYCSPCTEIMESDCSTVITDMGVEYIVFVDNNFTGIDYSTEPDLFKNTLKKYISTLDVGAKTGGYLIIVREEKNKRYYASIPFGTYSSGGDS